MARVPKWERLSDALKRVIASGVPEDRAKSAVSGAIADSEIRTRLTVVLEADVFTKWRHAVANARGLGSSPKWERLGEAVARLTAIGIDEGHAKQNICRAISDRRIKIKVRVAREEGIGSFGEHVAGTVQSGNEVEIPTDLDPSDLDWQASRPVKAWRDVRQPHSALNGSWRIEWIELLIESGDEATECFEGANINVPPHLQSSDFDWANSRPLNPWPVRPRGARLNEWRSFSRPALLIELRTADVTKVLCGGDRTNNEAETTTTVGQESAVIKALASHLKSVPKEGRGDVTRAKAEDWCRTHGFNISRRGFQSRVWPAAREQAELPRIAKSGRKRKSSH